MDADLKFVTLDVGAYGKQNDGGVFRNSALYHILERRSLQVPEDTVLPLSEFALPYIFVGDEAYLLTTYLIELYSRRTLDRSKAIFNYRLRVHELYGVLLEFLLQSGGFWTKPLKQK